jgi:hypothetical protein
MYGNSHILFLIVSLNSFTDDQKMVLYFAGLFTLNYTNRRVLQPDKPNSINKERKGGLIQYE